MDIAVGEGCYINPRGSKGKRLSQYQRSIRLLHGGVQKDEGEKMDQANEILVSVRLEVNQNPAHGSMENLTSSPLKQKSGEKMEGQIKTRKAKRARERPKGPVILKAEGEAESRRRKRKGDLGRQTRQEVME
jgi:hypothetical protein